MLQKNKNDISRKSRSNTFEFQDLSKIVNLAKRNKIFTFLDNTWGTPLYLKPLKLGFDMSFICNKIFFRSFRCNGWITSS